VKQNIKVEYLGRLAWEFIFIIPR